MTFSEILGENARRTFPHARVYVTDRYVLVAVLGFEYTVWHDDKFHINYTDHAQTEAGVTLGRESARQLLKLLQLCFPEELS